jgi:hypothetical protein
MKDSIIRLSVFFLILGIVYYFGWLAPHGDRYFTDHIYGTIHPNVDDFYWQVHPFKIWDAFAVIFFSAGVFVITGAYKIVIGEQYATKGEAGALYVIGAVAAIFGVLLFYA